MPNFSFSRRTQTDFDAFLTFKKKSEFSRKILKRFSKFIKFENADLCVNHQSIFMQNISYLSSTPKDFDIFLRFFRKKPL
jgi:hypothetical protein